MLKQHWQKLRQNTVECAFLTVIVGDLDNTNEAIDAADAVGALPSTLYTLRGLAALYRGELEDALSLTKQATEIDPQDFAAWTA